jgi:hypothetical protein
VAQILIHSALDEGFFGHGIYFVPLAAVSSTNGVVLAMRSNRRFVLWECLPKQ